jgi:hypothetical protein
MSASAAVDLLHPLTPLAMESLQAQVGTFEAVLAQSGDIPSFLLKSAPTCGLNLPGTGW